MILGQDCPIRTREVELAKSGRFLFAGWARAIAYGPFGYLHSLIAGFLVGNVAFLIIVAPGSDGSGLDKLPTLLTFTAGGVILLLLLTLAANFMIGRRIRDELELHRAIAARQAASPLALPIDHSTWQDTGPGQSAPAKAKRKRRIQAGSRSERHAERAAVHG